MFPNRTIQIAGENLLPPSSKPLPPADIEADEVVQVNPPCPPWAPNSGQEITELLKNPYLPQFDRRYWTFRGGFEGFPEDIEAISWDNEPGPGLPFFGSGHGMDRVPAEPLFTLRCRSADPLLPDLWEVGGMFVVSRRLLALLLEWDPEAILHRRILMRDPAGELIHDEHYFVDVVRNLWAVDFANSVIKYHGGGLDQGRRYPPYPIGYPSVRILEGLNSDFHIFRQAWTSRFGEGGVNCIISDALMTRIEAAQPPFTNVRFGRLFAGL